MCYSVSAKSSASLLVKEYNRPMLTPEQHKIYFAVSGFSHPLLPIISSERPNVIQHYRWGLLPTWTKDETQAKAFATNNLNARSETIFEKPSFRSVKKKRCLIPVNGFFEWMDFNKKKYPHFIAVKNSPIFSLGGIYDTWTNKETGELIDTFSIVTTEANPLMARVHNLKRRMPLILPKESEMEWLRNDVSEDFIKSLMLPLDETLMDAHTISKRITSRTDNPNDPETLRPFDYPELVLLD